MQYTLVLGRFLHSSPPSPLYHQTHTAAQGQFIYIKFAFVELATKAVWSLDELSQQLPTGLDGMFRYVLGVLHAALSHDRPKLLALLRTRVLPVLVAAFEPLTVAQLVWATCAPETQVG